MSNPKPTGLFAELTARMADVNLDGLDEPTGEVQDGDEVVGVLTDELKRLYAVRAQDIDACHGFNVSSLHKVADLMERHPSPDEMSQAFKDLAREKEVHEIRHAAIETLLSAAVRLEFPAAVSKNVAIREGWQVAVLNDHRSSSLPAALLSALLGR